MEGNLRRCSDDGGFHGIYLKGHISVLWNERYSSSTNELSKWKLGGFETKLEKIEKYVKTKHHIVESVEEQVESTSSDDDAQKD